MCCYVIVSICRFSHRASNASQLHCQHVLPCGGVHFVDVHTVCQDIHLHAYEGIFVTDSSPLMICHDCITLHHTFSAVQQLEMHCVAVHLVISCIEDKDAFRDCVELNAANQCRSVVRCISTTLVCKVQLQMVVGCMLCCCVLNASHSHERLLHVFQPVECGDKLLGNNQSLGCQRSTDYLLQYTKLA